MKYSKNLKSFITCAKCGSTDIVDIDIIDEEGDYIDGEDALIEFHIGKCNKCGADVQWYRCYKFVGLEDAD